MKLLFRTLALYGLLILLSQCQHVKPRPPQAHGFDSPIPPQLSYLAGPVTFRLRELEAKINRELDPVLVGKGTAGGQAGGVLPVRIERSGPVRIQYVNQQVKFSAPLQLWLAKPFSSDKTAPKKPFCALHVNFKSSLSVTPNWRLASNVKFIDYQWIIKPEIRLLGKEISLTKFVQKVLETNRSTIETAIDSAVYNDLRLDQTISPIWRDIQKPLLINRDYGLWLVPRPVSVAAGPISGNQETISTHLRIAFETQTELKPKPPILPLIKLPLLQKREQISEQSDLHVMSFITYADINRMLTRTLAKKPQKLAFGMLRVKAASVYGGQRTLIVKTEVAGLVTGTLYLRGRPVFDTLTNTLHVKNLEFDTNTEIGLSKFSGSFIHKGLRNLLEDMLTIPLGDEIAQLPQKIGAAFEKGGAGKKTDIHIQSFRFTPQKIAIRPDGIQSLISVESNIAVQVQKL